MRMLVLLILFHLSLLAAGQVRCATSDYMQERLRVDSSQANAVKKAEVFVQKNITGRSNFQYAVIRIPVVVHVLYNDASQNISDAQIINGIDVLNRDYRRRNADTVNTPQRFQSIAADVQIEFALATVDPDGRATNGIVRKWTNRNVWLADDKIKMSSQGGSDTWDAKSYLNIWTGNIAGTAGYSSVPGSAADKDGVVINYSVFGMQSSSSPFNLGRSAVHEVGHWLGLKHIWGDAACGDDGVDDTPTQGWYTQGCPTGFRSSCNNGSLGDMYMNYMDYTSDACMNLFTEGQKQRMRALFFNDGPRASILDSKGLQEPWLNETLVETTTSTLYPNPAVTEINLLIKNNYIGKQVGLYNVHGQVVKVFSITSSKQKIDVKGLNAGVYFIKGEGVLEKFIKL